ncbi:NAD-P-binding protein [Dentipellis sp. KUC8613]|nr:NAD-P-binding protein [Dentipellis sp. KUC8613]
MASSRVWLITGANSGLGLALAEYALSQGDRVSTTKCPMFLHLHNPSVASQVIAAVRNLSKLPASVMAAEPFQLDLSWSQEEIKAAGLKALSIHGHIDVLVNMAGYGLESPVEEIEGKSLEEQFHVNVFAPTYLTQSLLPSFRARNSGTILNISSIASLIPFPGIAAYCATKAALDSLTGVLAQEVAAWNIRVLIVQPGFFQTNWFDTAATMAEAARKDSTDDAEGSAYSNLYGQSGRLPYFFLKNKWIGDVRVAAQRMYEAGTGTGMAEGWDPKWTRVLLGVDCGENLQGFARELQDNIVATESMWRSTQITSEQMKELREAAGFDD